MNTVITKYGIGALVILVVLYVGNLALTSTPAGEARENFEYKVVTLSTECIQARIAAGVAGTMGMMFSDGNDKDMAEITKVIEQSTMCTQEILNVHASDGWELDVIEETTGSIIFKRN